MIGRRFAGTTLTLLASLALLAATASPCRHLDGAHIVNSSSTNARGWTIRVWSNGRADVGVTAHDGTLLTRRQEFRVPTALVQQFFGDLARARESHAPRAFCMKSVSFGSSTVVVWHGWTSPDVTCPQHDPALLALEADAGAITRIANVAALPLRVIRVPVEPRRPPPAQPQTQATPMPSPGASSGSGV
jgi:hypothetical protein